jgi:hypothetical protein
MLRTDYIFDASAKTITFTDSVVAANLEVVINSTDEIIIYNSVSAVTIGTLVGQVLTLAYDTTSMSDGDDLQIFYGDTAVTSSSNTFEELIAKANTLVDDSVMATLLGGLINQGVYEIAGGMPSLLNWIANPLPNSLKPVLPNSLTPPLPDLFTIDTVSTGTAAFVNMPTNFHRDLQFIASAAGSEIDIADSFIDFAETYPLLNKTGRISEVIEHGGKLYYQGIPTVSEAVTLHYYRKPVNMVNDDDTPDGIPEHLQVPLLVNFAAWKAYEHLEDGIEGEIPNTIKFKNAFLEAMRTLELSLPAYTRGFMLR